MSAETPQSGQQESGWPLPPAPGFGVWLGNLGRDIRYSLRSLRRAPGFSLAVFCTLAICFGPVAATLSALYSLVLKPLPFPDSRQLVTIENVAAKSGGPPRGPSLVQYQDYRTHADLFSGFGTIMYEMGTLTEGGEPNRLESDWVSPDFFDVLGVKPVLGRFFTPDEATLGRDHVLVVSQSFWESHFNADPGIIGRKVNMGGEPYTVVGVSPRSLESLSLPTCFFQPYAAPPDQLNPQARYSNPLGAIMYGRLKPGVGLGAGLAQLDTLDRRFLADQASPQLRAAADSNGMRIAADPLRAGGATEVMKSLWMLQAGAALVLLIGAVNAANLCLARMNARRAELAVRVALGAGRAALLRQMLAESLILTGAAALAGLAIAAVALHVFNGYLPIIARSALPVGLDLTVVGAILAAALGIALLVGLLPLQLLWRTGLHLGNSRTASSGGGVRTVSSVLVTAQVAAAVVLLVGASLLIRSFVKVMAVDPGIDAMHIVQGRTAFPSRFATADAKVGLQRRIVASMREIAGVTNVAALYSNNLPTPNIQGFPFTLRGQPLTAGQSQPQAYGWPASPDFFATMGMRIVAGRGFNDSDDFSKDPVVVVDQEFARLYFPDRIVLGQQLGFGAGPFPDGYKWPRIVGVVTHANLTNLDHRGGTPSLFIPVPVSPVGGFTMLIRSVRPAADILREMRNKLREIDPGLPLYSAGSLQQAIDNMLMGRRGITLLLGTFSALALLLAAVGLYGVLAYDVSQRTREIGIRGAIGASRAQILALILRQGMWKTGVGLVAGLAGACYLSHFLGSLLFDVTSVDSVTYLIVTSLLLAVSLLASWLPARRASKVDPIVALRCE